MTLKWRKLIFCAASQNNSFEFTAYHKERNTQNKRFRRKEFARTQRGIK